MKSKSDYTYTIHENRIEIIDLDKGHMSVTNNIENVVREICEKEHVQADQYMIIYKDSEGYWDGYENGSFVYLGMKTPQEAVERYIKLKHKHTTNETPEK